MKKDRFYNVCILIHRSTAQVIRACCTCPAGLSGCCNHATATLYCLEDYFHCGLHEDEQKGCTDRLQTWNQPRKRNLDARPTDNVKLVKHEYGVEKRVKIHRVNEWDCRPVCRRIVDPNKARTLREVLSAIQQNRMAAADVAVLSAQTTAEKRKAARTRCMLEKYGASCFVQLLDEEPSPPESHEEEVKKQRLARAAAQKRKFLNELEAKLNHVQHDHTYGLTCNDMEGKIYRDESPLPATPSYCVNEVCENQVKLLYENQVKLNLVQATTLEANTRTQFCSELWHNERILRITASIMKEVCHRRPTTSCKSFIEKKLFPKPVDTISTCYGRRHEMMQFYQKDHGICVEVRLCGLVIDSCMHWLAASPDRIVLDSTLSEDNRGRLEVKCPLVCEKKTIVEASRSIPAFCLVEQNGNIHLSKSHGYFYQVQTQMYVTNLKWCDFVVWSPVQDPFVERISFGALFMKRAISKAEEFYFKHFLPSVTPYMIIPSNTPVRLSIPIINSTSAVPVTNSTSIQTSVPLVQTSVPVTYSTSVRPSISVPATNTTCIQTSVPVTYSTSVRPSISVPATNTTCIRTSVPVTYSNVTSVHTSVPVTKNNDDIEYVGVSYRESSLPIGDLLQQLNVKKHVVKGDGSCLYHAVAHQAGLISAGCQGDGSISMQLRKVALAMMWKYPQVREEDGLSKIQWFYKRQDILEPNNWGGDLELRLLALGLHRNIVVVTASAGKQHATHARQFPFEPPPLPKMRGGIFIPLTTRELCELWKSWNPPLLIIYNGHSHYDSTIHTHNTYT